MSERPLTAYKVLTAGQMEALERDGTFAGAPVDLEDGYIHLSTAAQLTGTVETHFAGQSGPPCRGGGPRLARRLAQVGRGAGRGAVPAPLRSAAAGDGGGVLGRWSATKSGAVKCGCRWRGKLSDGRLPGEGRGPVTTQPETGPRPSPGGAWVSDPALSPTPPSDIFDRPGTSRFFAISYSSALVW